MQRHQRDDHDEKRQAVQSETGGRSEEERHAGKQRPEHAREIELDRVERDRVGQVLLVARARESAIDTPGPPNACANPVTNDSARMCQMRTWPKKTSAARMNAAVIWMYCEPSSSRRRSWRSAIDAADQREQQDRQLAEEVIEPEEER